MVANFFPQGVATGKAFLGRENEARLLKANIEVGHHTLLIGPRRFGKTSLARFVLNDLDMPFYEVNFFLSRSAKTVEKKIRNCIEKVLGADHDKSDRIFGILNRFFKNAKKKWRFSFGGLASVELLPSEPEDIEENIFTALNILESTMKELDQRVVLFFDEVQEIDLLENAKSIQGAIREFAQQSQHVIFIFSGSNRRLLHHMFDDAAMPLFELCERIALERIDAQIYQAYIENAAEITFGAKLDLQVIDTILRISERHPKRTYNLCHQLWVSGRSFPFSNEDVSECWEELVRARLSDIRVRLSKLTENELRLLTLIAKGYDKPITGKETQQALNVTSPMLVKLIQSLQDEDLVAKNKGAKYFMIDPLIKDALVEFET